MSPVQLCRRMSAVSPHAEPVECGHDRGHRAGCVQSRSGSCHAANGGGPVVDGSRGVLPLGVQTLREDRESGGHLGRGEGPEPGRGADSLLGERVG